MTTQGTGTLQWLVTTGDGACQEGRAEESRQSEP